MSHWQSKTKIRHADKKFSEYIRQRDGECVFKQKCYGVTQQRLECVHFYSRRSESVRFDPENSDAGCTKCHNWFHTTPEGQAWHKEWKKNQLGERAYDLLTLRKNTPGKKDDKMILLYIRELFKDINN